MHIVLMAGGAGSRFWPRSRSSNPKQLINMFGNRSMLQMTYDRISGLTEPEKVLVITNQDLREAVISQLPEIPPDNIIGEPFGRNTAPCIGLACAIIKHRWNDVENEVMVVLPADHLIREKTKFRTVLDAAVQYTAGHDDLLTMGIIPTYPETGYGYIQRNEAILSDVDKIIYKVKTFAEKPNRETAELFLRSGDFFWNSGMFVWNMQAIMSEFDEHLPELSEGIEAIARNVDTDKMDETITDVYSKIKSISIDYGILEVSRKVGVIQAEFTWNDVGSWKAVHHISQKDKNANFVNSPKHILIDSKDNYLYSSGDKMIVAVDVEGLVVVETDDALLICKKEQSQKVKNVVDVIRSKEWDEYL